MPSLYVKQSREGYLPANDQGFFGGIEFLRTIFQVGQEDGTVTPLDLGISLDLRRPHQVDPADCCTFGGPEKQAYLMGLRTWSQGPVRQGWTMLWLEKLLNFMASCSAVSTYQLQLKTLCICERQPLGIANRIVLGIDQDKLNVNSFRNVGYKLFDIELLELAFMILFDEKLQTYAGEGNRELRGPDVLLELKELYNDVMQLELLSLKENNEMIDANCPSS
ncbi:hypothetical protein L7F22_022754 [Adiantum nelumboides]|nr:hypothetical protein [Adiantum nelumboides]